MAIRQRGAAENVLVPAVAFLALVTGLVRGAVDRRAAPPPGSARGPGPRADGDAPGPAARAPEKVGPLDRLGRRFPPLAFVLAVQKRFSELHGNYLAGTISLQAFLSLFPLLLVVIAIAGFVTRTSTDLAPRIVGELGLTGDAATAVRDALAAAERSRRAASVVGFAGLLWSGLGLVGALQYAYNQVWQVEERGFKDRVFGIGWLLGAAIVFVASAIVTTVLGFLPGFLSPLALVVALATNVALWWWTARALPNRDVGWRPLLAGAVVGGVGLEILKVVGGYYVPRLVASSSQLYGSIGVVFAVLAWLLLFGKLVVYSAIVNVLLWEGKVGTKRAVVEVPAKLEATKEVTRSGRLVDVA